MISLATFLLNKTDIWRDTFEAVIPAFCVWSVDSDNWRRRCSLSTVEYVILLINKNDCWGSTWDASMNSSVCNKWQCSRLFFWKRWYDETHLKISYLWPGSEWSTLTTEVEGARLQLWTPTDCPQQLFGRWCCFQKVLPKDNNFFLIKQRSGDLPGWSLARSSSHTGHTEQQTCTTMKIRPPRPGCGSLFL